MKNDLKIPKISTKPDNLAIVNPKITKNMNKDALNLLKIKS